MAAGAPPHRDTNPGIPKKEFRDFFVLQKQNDESAAAAPGDVGAAAALGVTKHTNKKSAQRKREKQKEGYI